MPNKCKNRGCVVYIIIKAEKVANYFFLCFLFFCASVLSLDSEYDPEPNPPFFTSYAIKGTLDYLTSCHGGDSLVAVLCKTKVNVYGFITSFRRKLYL